MAVKQPFAVRLGVVERKALDLLAQADERQPGDMLRVLVRAEAKRRGLWAQAEALARGELEAPVAEPAPVLPSAALAEDDELGYDESALNSGGGL